jgi:hypothetical protein
MDYKKSKTLKTLKAASPETLFARFLQKRAQEPTSNQISTWEDDGGNYDLLCDDLVIISGIQCRTYFQKVRAKLYKYWRMARLYLQMQQSHYNRQ